MLFILMSLVPSVECIIVLLWTCPGELGSTSLAGESPSELRRGLPFELGKPFFRCIATFNIDIGSSLDDNPLLLFKSLKLRASSEPIISFQICDQYMSA